MVIFIYSQKETLLLKMWFFFSSITQKRMCETHWMKNQSPLENLDKKEVLCRMNKCIMINLCLLELTVTYVI